MDDRLAYYLTKVEKQLDFHRGLHLFEMEMNPNFTSKVVFLKENQEEYITNLFGNNKNIRESYNREFNSNVIVESTFNPKDEVKKFFLFIKENYINEIKKTTLINEGFFQDTWNKVKTKVSSTIEAGKKERAAKLAKMTPDQRFAFLKNEAEQEIKRVTEIKAKDVIAKLKVAFDLDKDNVYDDYDGTDEKGALAAIKLITTKNILDRVNQLIPSSIKPYKDLKGWLNDEMSDYDRDQYKAIWDRLGKLGYKGYNKNDFLAAAGKDDVVGMVKAGFTWLKDKGIPWFMEKLRDALGSTVGAILQQLLAYTGVGAIGTTILWAVLTLFDVSQIASGAGSWAKLIFSVFGLLTAGVLAKAIGGFLKPLFNTGGGIATFFANIAKKPWFITYVKPWVNKIGQAIGWASGLLKQAGDWVVKKLGATAIGGMVTKAVKWLRSISEMIVKYAGFKTKQTTAYLAKKDLQNQGKKIVTKLVTDPIKSNVKSYTKEKVAQGAGYVGGEKAKTAVELGYDVSDLKGKQKDIVKTFKKGVDVKSLNKAGEQVVSAVDKVGDVIDKTKKLASNEPVVPVKNATVPVG